MIVRNGAIIEYTGTWPSGGMFQDQTYTFNQVLATMTGRGFPVLRSSGPGFFQLATTFPVSLTLQNASGTDYGSENDVVSIIRNAVYLATGDFPTADSVPSVQNPSQPVALTGQPAAVATDSGSGSILDSFSGAFSSSGSSVSNSLASLASNTQLVVIGAGIGLVVAVLLIAKSGRVAA